MKREYDETIEHHYEEVAQEHGFSSTSTMADEITRELESDVITRVVGKFLKHRETEGVLGPATVMDVGCGNGYTLEVLAKCYPNENYIGVEKTSKLRSLALSRFSAKNNVKILEGDIRDRNFSIGVAADILLCQRVLINLLNADDQRLALNNILDVVISPQNGRMGGILVFIESFSSPLARLNKARCEFDLPPILPAYHNLYLADDFFTVPGLSPSKIKGLFAPPNFLSTHYYVSRVLHPSLNKDKPPKRNSEFVSFFSRALNQNIGDYSPLKCYCFNKV